MPARLIVYPPEAAAISRWIPAGARLCIGRDPACELLIDHPTVSRRHAELSHDGDGWQLLDLGSKNGSHVDGIQIAQARLEQREGWLRFGDVLCEFSLHEEAQAQAWQQRERERRALSAAWTRRIEGGGEERAAAAGPARPGPAPAHAGRSGAGRAGVDPTGADLVGADPTGANQTGANQIDTNQTNTNPAHKEPAEDPAGADLPADILRGVVELAGCSRGFLLLAQDQDFLVQASLSLEREDFDARAFSGSVGAVQRCLRERRPVVVNWIADDPWLAQRASVIGGGLQSLVCLPLAHGGRVLGAVYADRRGPGEAISEFDLELLVAFADSAALWLLAQRAFDSLAPAAEPLRWTRILGAQATSP